VYPVTEPVTVCVEYPVTDPVTVVVEFPVTEPVTVCVLHCVALELVIHMHAGVLTAHKQSASVGLSVRLHRCTSSRLP
jgi:hypothetical protein